MINQAIQKRRSIRSFTAQPISDDLVREIIMAAQFAPSAMNNRAWEFLILKDQAQKEQLLDLISTRFKQEVVKTASVVIIPLINSDKAVLPIQDLAIASENIFLQAAELGLGSFWKNVLPEEATAVKSAFGIPANYLLLNVIPIGYPDKAIEPHQATEFSEEKIHWGKWSV